MARSPGPLRVATLVGLAAAYLAAGKLGLSLALVHASASAVWPPTGIALAAFLLLGRSVWPAILAGSFLVNATTVGNAATSLGIAVGNTLEGLVGAWLVRRFAGGSAAFERPATVFGFLGLAGLVATAISPSIGVTSLCLGSFAPWARYGDIWLTWWLGDAGGAFVVAPALLLWIEDPRPRWKPLQGLELGAVLVGIALVAAIAFGGLLAPGGRYDSLKFLCLPLTIWTAFRFGRRETALAVLVLATAAIAFAVRGTGTLPGSSANEALLLLSLFLCTVSATSLSLAAVVAERRQALHTLAWQATELARSNAELDEFAHVVSHDLKAPLRGISSLAAWISADCKDLLPDESREHLALLEERAKRMGRLIDGVLGYSRAVRRPGPIERVDARVVAEEVIDSLGPLPGVTVRIVGSLPVVRYDRTQLAQVFQNLIQNAVEHLGRPRGEVVVSCGEREADFEFSVRDDGVGIPAAHLERIFRMFHAVRPEEGSSGVGLAIVKRIVEMHGGSVAVASKPGRGTTFRFSIPKL
jgi:signal transduction histidine kinase